MNAVTENNTVVEPEAPDSDTQDAFDTFVDEFDNESNEPDLAEDKPAEQPKVEEAKQEPEVPAEKPEPVAAEETEKEVPPEVVQPAPPEPVAQTPAETPPGQSYDELKSNAVAELEKRYALSQEDADAMISEPEAVIPKLAARLYVDIYENMMNMLQHQLPHVVRDVQTTSSRQQKDEEAFYTAWPALRNVDRNELIRIGQMYRQLNPQATREQFIQDVGVQSMVRFRLPIPGYNAPPPQPDVTPHMPARPTAPVMPNQSTGGNLFADLADEWIEDDKNGS